MLQAHANTVFCAVDTIPAEKYFGRRLQVSELKTVSWKGHKKRVTCRLINTGREPIQLGKGVTDDIVYQFGQHITQEIHPDDMDAIRTALLKKNLVLQVGQVSPVMEYRFRTANDAPSMQAQLPNNNITLGDSLLGCADLIVDSLWVIKQTKKSIIVGYRLINKGQVPLSLSGNANKTTDDVGLQFYYSSTPHVTKGSLPMGGILVGFGKKKHESLLMPMASLTEKATLPREQMTRFTPFIVVYADALQAVKECDETNNTASFFYK